MKKILIVDDDFLVCRFLSQLIDWEANGYELVGVARDGAQALVQIEKSDPDILIADIEMPVMNGIDLVKQVRKNEKSVKILMLTCHDDFVYVKEAIRAGADEYFLKDELTGEKLLELLKKFSEELEGLPEDSEEAEERKHLETEEKHLQQLLEGTVVDIPEEIPDAVLAIRIRDYEERIAPHSSEQREDFYKAFAVILREHIPEKTEGRVCHVRGGWFAVWIRFRKDTGRQEQQYTVLEMVNGILHKADKHFELKVQIGVAEAIDFAGETAASWEAARALLGYSFYENKQIFCSWQYGPTGNVIPKSASDFLEKAEEWKIKRAQSLILSAATTSMEAFKMEKTKETVVISWIRTLDGIFRLPIRTIPKQFDALKDVGKEYAAACNQHFSDRDQYSESIAAVIEYIQKNYRNNITLNAAANAVHLTPTYLSYVFHKETNVTFSEYLQTCRIDHARELLIGTDEKIREIGDLVGYNDYRHFCKTFKKTTGMTPQEYRKHGGKS